MVCPVMGVMRPGEGDGESERFELADVAAGLLVLIDAAGVVAGAQVVEAGG